MSPRPAPKTTQECSDVELVRLVIDRAKAQRAHGGDAGREFAIAVTSLEDAVMRLNRGHAIALGAYNEVDVQVEHG